MGLHIYGPSTAALSATYAPIDDPRFDAVGVSGGAYAASLAPVFIQNVMDGGRLHTTPANLRTGLATTRLPGGEFAEEMTIAVTGTAGSAVLTSAETTKVAGLGSIPWPGAMLDNDGTAFFVEVKSNNGSNQITLRKPLEADFTGVLAARHDENNGQHLTRVGYRAYAQAALRGTGYTLARGEIVAGTWHARPMSSFQMNNLWTKNAALTAYAGGTVDGVSPVLTVDGGAGIVDNTDLLPIRPTHLVSGVIFGAYAVGHGVEATINGRGRDSVLEFYTSTYRPNAPKTTAFAQLLVTVAVDGVTVYSKVHDHAMSRVLLNLPQCGKVTITITNNDGGVYYVNVLQTTLRAAGVSGRVGDGARKIVTFGDSWFTYYDDIFTTELAAQTTATVVNNSMGGQTSEWGLAWFDEYVKAEQPDECWIHFFTNDANNLSASTFTAPDGSTQPKWPSGLTAAQSLAHWRANMFKLIRKCQENGIRPVIFLPSSTGAAGQTQIHAEWAAKLEQPALAEGWPASTTEIALATAYLNTVGKAAGVSVFNTTTNKIVTATGSSATSTWVDSTGTVAHTPA